MRRLTSRESIIVAVAAAVAVGITLYTFVFAPEIRTLSLLNRRIAAQTHKLATLEAAAARLPAVQGEHAAVAARLRSVESRMPASISVSGLMGRLSTAIAVSGIQLIEVTFPAGTQPSASATEPVDELAFTMRFRGTFAHTITFLQLLESPPPLATEQSLNITDGSPAAPGVNSLDGALTMKAFAVR